MHNDITKLQEINVFSYNLRKINEINLLKTIKTLLSSKKFKEKNMRKENKKKSERKYKIHIK